MTEPELTQDQADTIAKSLGLSEPENQPQQSVNKRAEALMGRRLTPEQEAMGVIAFDQPAELGYWCPVCRIGRLVDGDYDERLHWSEYAGFVWCDVCDRDYPSALCVPLDAEPDPARPWINAGPADAVNVFLDSVQTAAKRHSTEGAA
jgi:hypothetical protein